MFFFKYSTFSVFVYGLDTENEYRKDNLENITSGLKLWYDALCLIPKTHRQLHTSQRVDKVSWTLWGETQVQMELTVSTLLPRVLSKRQPSQYVPAFFITK